jgi:NAD(P)-dependent dehydrogenase (short-subunit alcohol dehydrogenase family)
MELGLKGKVALVTGAGSPIGFGREIALTLAREGCDIIANDINLEEVEQAAAEVTSLGCKALAVKADVTNSAEVHDMVERAQNKFGNIDILVNNAGAAFATGPFSEQNEEDWGKDFNLNLKAFFICTKAVLPQMLERQWGKIINISSGTAKCGGPNYEAYAACKSGIGGFSKSLALAVATSGINVNCIAPGCAVTNFVGGNMSPGLQAMIDTKVPQKRPTTPRDIANMVAFLASDVSSNITGQMFSVDGGLTMTT